MANIPLQELIAAHNIARHNSDLEAAKNATTASVPEIVDPNRKPLPWPDTEDPFGNNPNNRRVAERIAKEALANNATDKAPAPVSSVAAALADLKAAALHAQSTGVQLTEAEQEAFQDEELGKAIKGLISKPVEPSTLTGAEKDQQDGAAAADVAAAATAKPAPKPAPGPNAPAWRQNA